jgi:hypothetical protein
LGAKPVISTRKTLSLPPSGRKAIPVLSMPAHHAGLQLIIVSFVNVGFICSKSTAKSHFKVALPSFGIFPLHPDDGKFGMSIRQF